MNPPIHSFEISSVGKRVACYEYLSPKSQTLTEASLTTDYTDDTDGMGIVNETLTGASCGAEVAGERVGRERIN